MEYRKIAIDGPAGAGKSTIAKAISKKLGINYLDTGAMYRSVAYYFIKNGLDLNEESIKKHLGEINLVISYENGVQKQYVNGEEVSAYIRTNDVSMGASAVAVVPEVRLRLVEIQRATSEKFDIVMDGRDIGTYVLPDAKLKFYITASSHERAVRRAREYIEKGISVNLFKIEEDINKRDKNDSQREFAPLKCAEDAIYLDTTNMSIDEVVSYVSDRIEEIYG